MYLYFKYVSLDIIIAGGISLARSGLVPVGKFIPDGHKGVPGTAAKGRGEVDEIDINLHLLPTNSNPQDNFGAHCVERHDREGKWTTTDELNEWMDGWMDGWMDECVGG